MKKINKYLTNTLLLLLLIGCNDLETNLDVKNQNDPNDEILLSDPTALAASAGGIIRSWHVSTHDNVSVGSALSVMSDNFSCSWGNYGMRDLSSEPRVEFNNTSGYSNAFITENYFNSMNTILADSNNLIIAVKNDINFGTDGSDNHMIEAIGRFGQALSTGYLALVFDRVWTSDETGPLNDGNSVLYSEAMTLALGYLDKAIAVADANTFTLPASWVPGLTFSNVELSKFMNSIGARMLTLNSRNTTERDATDWNKVLTYAKAGITRNFSPEMDDETWLDDLKWTQSFSGWGRVDMYTINLMASATPSIWPPGATSLPESISNDKRLLSDFKYLSSNNFRPDRGDYHFSSYRHKRYDDYLKTFKTTTPDFLVAENKTYIAEAKLRSGDTPGAAAVLNSPTNARKSRGGLSDVSNNFDEIEAAIHYERFIECANTGMGNSFFEMRKQNLLQAGTILHFPVPGSILSSANVEYYTFGGSTGTAGTDYSNGGWK